MPKKAVKIIKNVIWGILIGIFGILCVLVLWLAVDKFIFKSPVPSVFGYATLTVQTGSMSGTMEIGDLIVIKNTGDYKIGDIITFLHEGDTVPTTHRIINYGEDGTFITKGDANNVQDTLPVSQDTVLGEVIKILPQVGLFADWVKSEGWIYIVAVLIILGVGSFIIKAWFKPEEAPQGAENTAETHSAENSEEIAKAENAVNTEKPEDAQGTKSAENAEAEKTAEENEKTAEENGEKQ